MNIAIIGLGFVGFTTAVCFASRGNHVYGYDIDKNKLNSLEKGKLNFYESDLDMLLRLCNKKGTLHLTSDVCEAVTKSKLIFITVGTPSNKDGSANLEFLKKAANDVGKCLKHTKKYQVAIVKSTVPPGTAYIVKKILEKKSEKKAGKDFGLCSNPEFLREGNAVFDTFNPDKIVIGSDDKKFKRLLLHFYKSFYKDKHVPIISTNLVNAEIAKHANNSFLALKINFINSIANICQKIPNADVKPVAEMIGLDKRISPLFLQSGLGYGGSCFPKDVKALHAFSKRMGYYSSILDASIKTNQNQPKMAIVLAERLAGDLANKKISILGLAFKPNTDDMREAVSIPIIKELIKKKCKINVHDPMAIESAKKIFANKITYGKSIQETIQGTECCIIITEWDEYKKLKPSIFKKYMKKPIVVDGRRIFEPETFKKEKISFAAIGLGT